MNFGAEGERILEMRQKQKQQYREDLLKQIQEQQAAAQQPTPA